MPQCDTKYFGPTEYSEGDVISFPAGLPGFPEETAFLVLQRPDQYPLVYLQSVATPQLCFLAMPILTIDSGYSLRLNADDAEVLGTTKEPRIGEDVLCLALIVVREAGPTANLFAPVVINLANHTGGQCFNATGSYSHQHPLVRAEKEVAA